MLRITAPQLPLPNKKRCGAKSALRREENNRGLSFVSVVGHLRGRLTAIKPPNIKI